jgi:hypothetical protein
VERAKNPFAPGAGNQPPELAGRDQIIEEADVALQRVKAARNDRGQMLLGLRGVGKTVLLNHIEGMAESAGYYTILLEASEEGRLAELLAPRLRGVLVKLSARDKARDLAQRGLGALRGFASAFKVSIGGVDIEIKPEAGTADSGNLELDLPDLLVSVGDAAKAGTAALAICVDEVQYLKASELAAVIVAMHRVSQKNLPILFFGAGLPQIAGLAGDAKSYAERLFRYPDVGQLPPEAAADAIRKPLEAAGVAIAQEALAYIVEETKGYPYFLQEWGYHAWNVAADSPITLADAKQATVHALQQLDTDFFRVRFDRLTPREKDYMRAMASLGPGPHRSAEIAGAMGYDSVEPTGSLRNDLIKKGMIYGPEHGWTAFTVPMFDAFMRRSMPEWTVGDAKGKKKNR